MMGKKDKTPVALIDMHRDVEALKAREKSLRERIRYLEKTVNDHKNVFEWLDVLKGFFQKAMVAAYAAKIDLDKEEDE